MHVALQSLCDCTKWMQPPPWAICCVDSSNLQTMEKHGCQLPCDENTGTMLLRDLVCRSRCGRRDGCCGDARGAYLHTETVWGVTRARFTLHPVPCPAAPWRHHKVLLPGRIPARDWLVPALELRRNRRLPSTFLIPRRPGLMCLA